MAVGPCLRPRPFHCSGQNPADHLQTNVVTVLAPSVAVKDPPLTGTAAVPAFRLSVDEVTYGMH